MQGGIICNELGKMTFSREVQFSKMSLPDNATESGITISLREVHSLKAFWFMLSTEFGIVICSRKVQPEKAP